jgi:hypothetical protein
MKIWKFDAKKILSVELMSYSIPVEMYRHQILTLFSYSVEITVAVEPYESLGIGGPVLKYLPSTPFFPIFGLTAVPNILVFRALALGVRSPIYDKLGINNPSSKSSPLHILMHAILVPEERCNVSTTGRPR